MSERINVLGIEINNYTAKEAMQRVVEYMKRDSLQVVARMTPKSIKHLMDEPEYVSQLEDYEIVLLESKELLQTAGIFDKQLIKEMEDQTFFRLFGRYLHKNQKKVFLLAETTLLLREMQSFIMTKFPKITVEGTVVMEEHTASEDMIVNAINMADADCIIAAVSSPTQERFVKKYRTALNAKIWMGFGVEFAKNDSRSPLVILKEFVEKNILKRTS